MNKPTTANPVAWARYTLFLMNKANAERVARDQEQIRQVLAAGFGKLPTGVKLYLPTNIYLCPCQIAPNTDQGEPDQQEQPPDEPILSMVFLSGSKVGVNGWCGRMVRPLPQPDKKPTGCHASRGCHREGTQDTRPRQQEDEGTDHG